MSQRRLRWSRRTGHQRVQPNGTALKVRAFGVRVGYWPCLKAPFIELAFNTWRYELWYGLPSYKDYSGPVALERANEVFKHFYKTMLD